MKACSQIQYKHGLVWEGLPTIQQPVGKVFWFQLLLFFLLAVTVLYFGFNENEVDNKLMLYMLLSRAYTKPRAFQPWQCPGWRAQEAGRGHSQSRDSWSQLDEGISWTIWCHTQHIKPGELAGGCSPQLREWLHIEQLIAHPSVCTFFYHYNYFLFYWAAFITSPGCCFFSDSLPIPCVCVCVWANDCLNHNKNKTLLLFLWGTDRLLEVENQKQKYGMSFGDIRSVPFVC